MDEMTEMRKFVEEMNGVADINRKLRAENEDLKQKLAYEREAKNEEISKHKMTARKYKQYLTSVRLGNKGVRDTMASMDEKIMQLEEQLKVSQKQVESIQHEKQVEVAQEQVKIIHPEKELNVSQEQVKALEEESANHLQSFHDAERRLAEADRQLHFRSEDINRLRENVESLLKYKENYMGRNVACKWIIEDLDELEDLTTHFSFLRRRTTKRLLVNRIKDLIGRTMMIQYNEEDNDVNQWLPLRR